MKYFVEYFTWDRAGNNKHGWGVVEFAFRRDITKDSIKAQLVPDYEKNFHVDNIVKL